MRLFDAAYEADSSGPGRGCVERERRGRCVVSQPKLQLQLEFNVNNCLQLHVFICTPFAQLPHLPQPPWLPTVPYPSWCCPLSLLLMTPWWWCVACACACAGQLATGFGWRPCRLVSLWFAFHLCMRPGHVYYFISFHFIWVFSFSRPLYYDYHVLFNNWCANWQLSGSFTTLHMWRTTTAAAEAEGREPVGWHSLCFRSINHIVIYSGKHI